MRHTIAFMPSPQYSSAISCLRGSQASPPFRFNESALRRYQKRARCRSATARRR